MTIKKLFKKAIGAIVAGAMVVAMAVPAMADEGTEPLLTVKTSEKLSFSGAKFECDPVTDFGIKGEDVTKISVQFANDGAYFNAGIGANLVTDMDGKNGNYDDTKAGDFDESKNVAEFGWDVSTAGGLLEAEGKSYVKVEMWYVEPKQATATVSVTSVSFTTKDGKVYSYPKATYPLAKITVNESCKPSPATYGYNLDVNPADFGVDPSKVDKIVVNVENEAIFNGAIGGNTVAKDDWDRTAQIDVNDAGKNTLVWNEIGGLKEGNIQVQIWWMNAKGSEEAGFTPATLKINDVVFYDAQGAVLGTAIAKNASDTKVYEEPKQEDETPAETPAQTPAQTPAESTTPATAGSNTGDGVNTGLLIAIAAVLAIVGTTVVVRKRAEER